MPLFSLSFLFIKKAAEIFRPIRIKKVSNFNRVIINFPILKSNPYKADYLTYFYYIIQK